jgi:hypothetical protein
MGFNQTQKQIFVGKWHRRLGFLVTGMLLVFAVSGIALNHQSHWDPYYTNSKTREVVEGLRPSMSEDELDQYLRQRYGVEEDLESAFWESSLNVTMTYTNGVAYVIDLQDKSIVKEVTRKRPGIYNLIHLHLNGIKGLWIFAADAFAVGLIVLSLSGIYLAKGRYTRNEYFFLTAGILIPVLFYLYL